jgi:hypothetical protein
MGREMGFDILEWELLNNTAKPFAAKIKREWLRLLRQRLPEQTYHSYLHNHAGFFFDEWQRPVVISKLRLGGDFVTDFVLLEDRGSDGTVFHCIEIETPWTAPFNSKGNPSARLSAAIQQIQNWRRWLLDNRNQALKLFPAFRVRAYREATFKFKIIIGNRGNSLKWLERRHDLAQDLKIGIRSFDLFTDIFDRHLFANYTELYSTESNALDRPTKNRLANPFYCAYTDTTWHNVIREPLRLDHFTAWNAATLLKHRVYSPAYARFIKRYKRLLQLGDSFV